MSPLTRIRRGRLVRAFGDVLPPGKLLWWLWLPMWGLAWLGLLGSKPAELQAPVLACLTLFYGMWRAVGQHPLLPGHRAWLEQTPWTPGERLPLGPVRLVWQDVGVLALLLAPAVVARSTEALLAPLGAFLLVYSVSLGCTFLRTGISRAAYPLAFALGGLGLTEGRPEAALAILVGMTVWTQLCLPASLRGFPWTDGDQPQVKVAHVFPYAHLQHGATYASIGWSDALAVSALSGWWLYVGERAFGMFGRDVAAALVFVMIACFVRLCIYLHQTAAPISLLGRLRTLRLVIPGFDKVFVGPGLALVATIGVLATCQHLQASSALTLAATWSTGLALLLLLGPNLERWRLTGYARIAPPLQMLQAQQQRELQARQQRTT